MTDQAKAPERCLIEQAIVDQWGERCDEFDPDCFTCRAWKSLDFLAANADAVAGLWHAARLGLDMARANDLTNTAAAIMEAMNAVKCPCRGSDEMCPCQNRRPQPTPAEVVKPPRLMAMCGHCRSAGEEYCVQYLKDLRWDGAEWCCKDCFDGSGENGDWDEATQPYPQTQLDAWKGEPDGR